RGLAARGDSPRGNVVGEVDETVPTIEPTKLYSHNTNVDAENERELAKIQGRIFEYQMDGHGNKKLILGLKKSCLAPERLKLKRGARVMFVKNNYEKGYVNGTLGIVDDCGYENITVRTVNGQIYTEKETWRVEDNGRSLAEIEQYPLRLAWAITIHKSQGMSLDAAHIDLSQSFEKGMGYVALSRLRSLAGLHLLGLNNTALQVHNEALEYDKRFQELSASHRAEFAVMSEDEIRKLHVSFLGPELTLAQREGDMMKREKGERKKKFEGNLSVGGKKEKVDSRLLTKQLIDSGMSIKDAANSRGFVAETIIGHIEKIKQRDSSWDISRLRSEIPNSRFEKIAKIFYKVGMQEGGERPLGPVKGILGGAYSYEEIRLVRLFL
ncbi:MAG: helix-turn-helix domain-containing protein, partial [Patescibacteria group bacterium]